MRDGTPFQFGEREVTLAPLRLGQMKRAKVELDLLMKLGNMNTLATSLPSAEQIDAMTTIVHLSASASEPELTREAFGALVDDLPFDDGLQALADALKLVMGRSGAAGSGEAASPATIASTSSGSTE